MRTCLLLLPGLLLGAAACGGPAEPDTVGASAEPCPGRSAGPAGSEVQRARADLDGDGRADELLLERAQGGPVLRLALGDGRTAVVDAPFSSLLAAADVEGDGRAEVFGAVPADGAAPGAGVAPGAGAAPGDGVAPGDAVPSGESRGGVFVLQGCRLLRVAGPTGPLEYVYGTGPDRLQAAATLRCANGGLEQVVSTPAPAPGFRLLRTTRWTIEDGRAQAPTTTSDRVAEADDPALATPGRVVCG